MALTIPLPEIIGYLIAVVVTILIFSYTFGDNPLYKMIIHIFIGSVAGYAGAIALRDVLIPQLMHMSINQAIIPIILVLLLLLKVSPRTAQLGNISSALLLGVGAAIAIQGAIQGTLIPFISSSSTIFSPTEIQKALENNQTETIILLFLQGSVILIGIITTLTYFQFTARKSAAQAAVRPKIISTLAKVGRGFIAITFGVIFAGIYSAALTALVERIDFLINTVNIFLGLVK